MTTLIFWTDSGMMRNPILIHFDPFWSNLIHLDPFDPSWFILVHFEPFWSILRNPILIHIDPFWSNLIIYDPFWSILIHLDSFILAHFDPIFSKFQFGWIWRKISQHSVYPFWSEETWSHQWSGYEIEFFISFPTRIENQVSNKLDITITVLRGWVKHLNNDK